MNVLLVDRENALSDFAIPYYYDVPTIQLKEDRYSNHPHMFLHSSFFTPNR